MAVTMEVSQGGMAWGAQSCSREAWRGLPRLFVNSYFSMLSTGLQRVGQFSLHFREHKTCPKSLSGLRVQPGPTSLLLSPFEPMFWKAFGGSQEKWTPPCPTVILQENASTSRKKQAPGVMHCGGKERDQYLGS